MDKISEYQKFYSEDDAPGWSAIDEKLDSVYKNQEPKHWGTVIPYSFGGPDPLDGISAYQCFDGGFDHLHFCTYGFSSLYYDEESIGKDFSGYGFELTFRLKSDFSKQENLIWVCNFLQNLARYVFDSDRWFEEYHWIPANGPIEADSDTAIVGCAFLQDPTLGTIDTPHGHLEFIQIFGLNQSELDSIMSKKTTCAEIIELHKKENPLLITDLSRH